MKVKTRNDEIEVKIWTWVKRLFLNRWAATPYLPYYSHVYKFSSETLYEYWEEIAKRDISAKIIVEKTSFTRPLKLSQLEAVQIVFSAKYGRASGIVIYNLSQELAPRLAEQIPGLDPRDLLEDYLVFPAPSREAALRALWKIPAAFADVVAIDQGNIIAANFEYTTHR